MTDKDAQTETGGNDVDLQMMLKSEIFRAAVAMEMCERQRAALEKLYSVVIRQNRLGANWHQDVFGDLLDALAKANTSLGNILLPLDGLVAPTDKKKFLALMKEFGVETKEKNSPTGFERWEPGLCSIYTDTVEAFFDADGKFIEMGGLE